MREYSPPDCVAPMQKIISVADKILLGGNKAQIKQLKGAFGLDETVGNTEFAASLYFDYEPYLHNWVPCLDESDQMFCDILSSDKLQYTQLAKNKTTVQEIIKNGGWANETQSLTVPFMNYIGLITDLLPGGDASSSSHITSDSHTPASPSLLDELLATERAPTAFPYTYQLCTEFGWFMSSGGPQWPLPIISSLVTVEYLLGECAMRFNLTTPPLHTYDMTKYGGYNLSYPRLMLVGGEKDPVSFQILSRCFSASY